MKTTLLTDDQRRRMDSVKANRGKLSKAESEYLKLNEGERRTLEQHEAIIERSFQSFVEVGSALAEIRDKRLYREEYHTFDDYLKARWNMGKARAYQLINAAEVQMSTTVDIPNERVARVLDKVPAKQRAEILEEAEEQFGEITEPTVRKVIERRQQPPDKPAAASIRPDKKNALVALAHLVEAIAELSPACQQSCDGPIKSIRAAINAS